MLGDSNCWMATFAGVNASTAVCAVFSGQQSPEIIAKVEANLHQIERYNISIERADKTGYITNTDLDLLQRTTHSHIDFASKEDKEIELCWIDENAFAFSQRHGQWFWVAVPLNQSLDCKKLFKMFKDGNSTVIGENDVFGDLCRALSLAPNIRPFTIKFSSFSEHIVGSLCQGSEEGQELFTQIAKGLPEIETQVQFRISKCVVYILQASVSVSFFEVESNTRYQTSDINHPHFHISLPPVALGIAGPPIATGALFVKLPAKEAIQ